jgi:S-DNA-T family DNA segregation ATPase FtsK/SpoIIIE
MLYSGVVDPFPIRMQGAFISEEEVETVVEHVKSFGKPDYIDDEMFFEEEEEDAGASLFTDGDDPLYDKALEIVMQQGKASASYIQRRLKIGFNRAARLVDEMEHNGIVGAANGSKPRELLRGA